MLDYKLDEMPFKSFPHIRQSKTLILMKTAFNFYCVMICVVYQCGTSENC